MDYYQTVSSDLRPRGAAFAIRDLLLAFVVTIGVGFAFLHLQGLLFLTAVPERVKAVRNRLLTVLGAAVVPTVAKAPSHAGGPAGSNVKPPESKPAPQQASPPTASPPLKADGEPVKVATPVCGDSSGEVRTPSQHTGGGILDDALDDFFESDRLLSEALLDATVSKPTHHMETDGRTAEATSEGLTSVHKETEPHTFDKELAKRMTRGLQKPSAAPRPTATQVSSAATALDGEEDLDRMLDGFMAEEAMLNEAIHDTAVAAAKGSQV